MNAFGKWSVLQYAAAIMTMTMLSSLGIQPIKAQTIAPAKGFEWWETREECQKAVRYIYYIPRTTSPATKLPPGHFVGRLGQISGTAEQQVKDYCVQMPLPELRGITGWVRQSTSEEYIFRQLPNGDLAVVAAVKCRNRAIEIVPNYKPPQPPPQPQQPPQPPPPQQVELTGKVDANVSGNVGVSGKVEVVHSGEVRHVHEGSVTIVQPRKPGVCGPLAWKCWIIPAAIGIGLAVWGITRGKEEVTTAPATGNKTSVPGCVPSAGNPCPTPTVNSLQPGLNFHHVNPTAGGQQLRVTFRF